MINFPRLTAASGGDHLAQRLLDALEANPTSDLTPATVDVLRTRTPLDQDAFMRWWQPRSRAAAGTTAQSGWLSIGARFGIPRLKPDDTREVTLTDPADCQAALSVGASPPPRSPADPTLLRAVLEGGAAM